MSNTANLKKDYLERIVPALQKEFNYSTVMQVPVLKKIVINQGLGEATADKKIIETAINELTDRKSTRLNSSHKVQSRMPSSA